MMGWADGLFELPGFVTELFSPGSREELRRKKNEELYMPLVQIEDLPDDARVWVFGADKDLDAGATDLLLREVDRFLSQWHAHGAPLTVGRDWKYGRFLTVAVDQSTAGASGCSIDGLFRALKALESRLGASLVTSGVVFYRGRKGAVECTERERFTALSAEGKVKLETHVFDPTVTTLGEWRARFELEAGQSWHAGLLQDKQPA
jgi:hypothetical protein